MAQAPPDGVAWECAACGHHHHRNREGVSALVCEACGVAKRYVGDPALDLPSAPAFSEVPSFWYGVGWLLAAAVGGALLLAPTLLDLSGMGRNFLLIEVGASLYAAASSFLNAVWERWFNQVELVVPAHAATGKQFTATLTLVPYRALGRVSVRLKLIDRFYERDGKSGVKTLSRVLASYTMLGSGDLRARRAASFEAGFITPFPATKHTDVMAEMTADVLDVVARFVPAVGWNADNLRQHGGYIVEAEMRVGIIRRRLHKRLLAYHLGEQIYVG